MKTGVLILGVLAAIGCGNVTALAIDDGGTGGAAGSSGGGGFASSTGGATAATGGAGGLALGAGGAQTTGGVPGTGGVPCSSGQLYCAGVCVASDALHCGNCATTCTSPQVCSNNSCSGGGSGGASGSGGSGSGGSVAPCPAPNMRCSDGCHAVEDDGQNCGTCGHACATGQTCTEGACSGLGSCNGRMDVICSLASGADCGSVSCGITSSGVGVLADGSGTNCYCRFLNGGDIVDCSAGTHCQ